MALMLIAFWGGIIIGVVVREVWPATIGVVLVTLLALWITRRYES